MTTFSRQHSTMFGLLSMAVASILVVVASGSGSNHVMAFAPSPPPMTGKSTASTSSSTTTQLHIFGNLKDAFSNDNSLGARKNEGLANGPNYNEDVTVNGKPVKGAVVGQKLTVVAGRARVKIPVNCQKGDCGTCMVKMNGKKVKACQATLGSGKCTIETL